MKKAGILVGVFFSNFIGTLKKCIEYRFSALFSCAGTIITVLAQVALWASLYRGNPVRIKYMIAYVVLSRILSTLYNSNIAKKIEARVRSGDLALDLVRPVGVNIIYWSSALGEIAANLLLRGGPLLVVFGWFLTPSDGRWATLWLFLIASILGCVLYTSLYMMVGYLSFKTSANWPYIRILDDTIKLFAGAVLPISLFPSALYHLAELLPFRCLYYFPIELLIGQTDNAQVVGGFAMLFVWTMVSLLLLHVITKAVEGQVIIQGG